MSLALIIATADRPDALAATLGNLANCQLPGGQLEVVVADNGTAPATRSVCSRDWPGLAVRHLAVARRGKTIAQNAATEATDAHLLAFTDDDVQFDARWLQALWRAANDWPEHLLFGGRIVPLWPEGPPPHVVDSMYAGVLYTLLDLGDEEGPVPGFRPFGPNMAVRRSVFDTGIRFDEVIGPGSSSEVSMGDETGIARHLEAIGETAVYVPDSLVYHQVREEQLSLGWQLRRGVRYGRMLGYYAGSRREAERPKLFGISPWVFREAGTAVLSSVWHGLLGRRGAAFDRLMEAAIALGRGMHERASSDSAGPIS